MPCFQILHTDELKLGASPMSLDDTLRNLNGTLDRIADLLHTVEIAILIVAIALSILMIGSVAVCYYDKYKKYNTVRTEEDDRPSYTKSNYHHTDL